MFYRFSSKYCTPIRALNSKFLFLFVLVDLGKFYLKVIKLNSASRNMCNIFVICKSVTITIMSSSTCETYSICYSLMWYNNFWCTLEICIILRTMPFLIYAASITFIRPFSDDVRLFVTAFWQIMYWCLIQNDQSASSKILIWNSLYCFHINHDYILKNRAMENMNINGK